MAVGSATSTPRPQPTASSQPAASSSSSSGSSSSDFAKVVADGAVQRLSSQIMNRIKEIQSDTFSES